MGLTLPIRILMQLMIAMEVVIALVIVRRRLYREVPWFTVYVVYQIISATILAWVEHSGTNGQYFYGVWISEGVSVTLAFLVILEIFRKALIGYEAIRKAGVTLLVTVTVGLVLVSVLIYPHGSFWEPSFLRFVLLTERSVRIVQVGLILSIFAFSSYLALSWRSYLFGIALGYGLFASADLAFAAASAFLGPRFSRELPIIDFMAFFCTVALWLIYLLRSTPVLTTDLPLATARADLQRWNNALEEMMGREKVQR